MRAVVLCAGLGTRLRPLTNSWPKPAIPVLGQPLLRYSLAMLRSIGVQWAGINTHHLPKVMQAVASFECRRAGIQVELSHEPIIQGTGGGIRGFRRWLSDAPFLVLNGDVLFSLPLAALLQAHRDSGALATMALMSMPTGKGYAAVETDASGRIWRIAGRGTSPTGSLQSWHFTGIHVLSPNIFDFMSKTGAEDINREVYLRVIEKGGLLRGHQVNGYWSDLGTAARYLRTQDDLLRGRVSLPEDGDASPFHQAREELIGCWLRGSASIEGAKVTGPAFFDDGARLLSPAKAGPNVYLGPSAAAGPNSKLEHATVLEQTVLRPGENLTHAIAWGDERLLSSNNTAPARR